MQMNPQLLDEAIAGLYSAAAGRLDWKAPLDAVKRGLDLWGVQIISIDKHTGSLTFSAESDAPPGAALDYIRTYHTCNPRLPLILAAPPGTWAHCHEHLDENFVANSPFYQDFFIPYGGRYLTATKIIDDENTIFTFAVFRGVGQDPIGSEELAALDQIKFHSHHALRNFMHLRSSYAELGVARELLNKFNYPMLLVDETRAIWYRNDEAEAALQEGDYITERGGLMVCQFPTDDAAITEAIHALRLDTPPQNQATARRVARIRKTDGGTIFVHASAIRPEQAMGAFGHAARALLIFHDPDVPAKQIDPFIVAEVFDLTPAEARLAVQLAEGKTLQEVSECSRVAMSTIRTQLSAVFAKTGVNRQSDLVRLLATLPQ